MKGNPTYEEVFQQRNNFFLLLYFYREVNRKHTVQIVSTPLKECGGGSAKQTTFFTRGWVAEHFLQIKARSTPAHSPYVASAGGEDPAACQVFFTVFIPGDLMHNVLCYSQKRDCSWKLSFFSFKKQHYKSLEHRKIGALIRLYSISTKFSLYLCGDLLKISVFRPL